MVKSFGTGIQFVPQGDVSSFDELSVSVELLEELLVDFASSDLAQL